MTPKQRHRAEAFDLARTEDGMVRCCLRGFEGHECGGRLQAHHVVSCQRLRILYGRAVAPRPLGVGLTPWMESMQHLTLDDLIADPRNSQIVCELGHRQIELGKFAPAPSPQLVEFATDYGLEHLIEPATERAA